MAGVHLTTIPCEPSTTNSHIEGEIVFGEISPCTNNIVYSRFEVFRSFLCNFMIGFRVFLCKQLWVNVRAPSFSERGTKTASILNFMG